MLRETQNPIGTPRGAPLTSLGHEGEMTPSGEGGGRVSGEYGPSRGDSVGREGREASSLTGVVLSMPTGLRR